MEYFLIFFSFLLHIITFIIIKTMHASRKDVQEVEDRQQKNREDIENLMAIYLLEIKEENDRVIQIIEQNEKLKESINSNQNEKKSERQPKAKPNQKQEMKSANPNKQTKMKSIPSVYKDTGKSESAVTDVEYVPPLDFTKNDIIEQSLSAKVFSLYDKGESVEAIARKLDCGRTEVELILKFHR